MAGVRKKRVLPVLPIVEDRADNEFILRWWTPLHDQIMREEIRLHQEPWVWSISKRIEQETAPEVLESWRADDPLCSRYAWYNILMNFAAARAHRLGLTKDQEVVIELAREPIVASAQQKSLGVARKSGARLQVTLDAWRNGLGEVLLRRLLAEDRAGNCLILGSASYYVQFAAGADDEGLYMEAVSNEYLPPESQLSNEQERTLVDMGLSINPASLNYSVYVLVDVPSAVFASSEVFSAVYRIGDDELLGVETFFGVPLEA
jgi:hypothetical protein